MPCSPSSSAAPRMRVRFPIPHRRYASGTSMLDPMLSLTSSLTTTPTRLNTLIKRGRMLSKPITAFSYRPRPLQREIMPNTQLPSSSLQERTVNRNGSRLSCLKLRWHRTMHPTCTTPISLLTFPKHPRQLVLTIPPQRIQQTLCTSSISYQPTKTQNPFSPTRTPAPTTLSLALLYLLHAMAGPIPLSLSMELYGLSSRACIATMSVLSLL